MVSQTPSHHLHFAHALRPAGWSENIRIELRGGRIAAISSDIAPQHGDECHAIGLPGVPNLHSHAFQRGMAGLAEVQGPSNDSFWTWREVMYRFVARIDPEGLLAVAALAYMEMLETGFTRVGEFHYLHHDRSGRPYADRAAMSNALMEAATETGIALTLLPVFYAHSDFGGAEPHHGQCRFVHDRDSFARLMQDLETPMASLTDGVLGLAPHSLRAVTPAELVYLEQIRPNFPIHIHIAEQPQEVDACVEWSGARPVQWLLDHANVAERWCLVHATHMNGAEAGAVARSGAVVGLCPITEANLGDGIFRARPFCDHGGRFGIGSDSNVRIDMTEELRLFEYGQRLSERSRNRLAGGADKSTGQSLYTAALAGGGQALGCSGGIAVGNPADLVSIDIEHPSFYGKPIVQILDALIFSAGRSGIDCVWRAGEKSVSAGVHKHRQRITERYKRHHALMMA